MGIKAVDVVHNGGSGIVGAGRTVGGVKLGRLVDIVRIQPGDFTDLFQRILLRQRLVWFETVGVPIHILHIRPAIVHDKLRHAQSQSAVRSGINMQKDIRQVFCRRRVPDIDDNNLSAPFLQFSNTLHGQMVGIVAVVVPPQKGIGVSHIRSALTARRHLVRDLFGHGADAVVRAEIHTAEHVGEPVVDRPVPFGVSAVKGHGMRGILFFYLVQPFSDDLVCFLPADRLKFPLPPLPNTAQRCFDPVFPVNVVALGGTFGAEFTVAVRVSGSAFHPDDFPVLHITVQAAVMAGAADRAEGMADFNSGVLPGNFCFHFLFQFSQGFFLLKS